MKLIPSLFLAGVLCTSLSSRASAHDSAAAHEMTDAASNFLKALTPEQLVKAQFAMADEERKNWHFVPKARNGLSIKDMTQGQRLLAHSLLVTGLSNSGYKKALSIMSLEEVLAELEKSRPGGNVRDPELYFVSVFGEPGSNEGWAWRFEGHHLALNFTAGPDDVLSMTPSFFGSNPGEVRQGPRAGTRVLTEEEELGRSLVKSLSQEQRKTAVILAEAPKEIFNLPGRNEFTKVEGIPQSQLSEDQKAALTKLVQVYLQRHRLEAAAEEWARIEKAGVDKIHFAWAGGLEAGQPHYYRLQGPTFVVEYDNVQNGANHVHSLWRDLTNDFGVDLLKQHYEKSHSAPRK
jgi:hypothetical protein